VEWIYLARNESSDGSREYVSIKRMKFLATTSFLLFKVIYTS